MPKGKEEKALFKDKSVLITGGSGSLGRGLLKRISKFNRLVIFSRSEHGQDHLRRDYPKVEFVLGDVRDLQAVKRAVKGMDIVIHAAAFKYLDLAEAQPRECVLTNVLGSLNVLQAVEEEKNVKVCIGISTDKSVYARNVYGCTKHIMEKLFCEADRHSAKTKYCCARYGNVKGTAGSVFTIWERQMKLGQPITVTDPNMTRFFFSLDEAIDLIFYAIKHTKGGEVFAKQMSGFKMGDLAKKFAGNHPIKVIGLRKGEKINECLVADYEGEELTSDNPRNEGQIIAIKP